MPLTLGTRVGPYEVLSALGAGGMGEVYRARDSRLGREVAIKVLPEAFAADAERVARFQREAQVLASLNHPNIAAIYGLEDGPAEAGHYGRPKQALILELVEGPTLADRIVQGTLPLDEALPIARQIAEALEAAHEHGVIHRDLKPANIKLRPDGVVKVLDFGLAKLAEPASGVRAIDVTGSPTITSPAMMTDVGMILGTAAYMAPEQARGRPADKRSDVWAFGCVLYEMLTGRRAFDGDDVAEVLASVIQGVPDWNALPAAAPPSLHRLLRRCLQKDRKHRLPDMADARIEIDEALAPPAYTRGEAIPAPATRTWRVILPWAAALVLSVATGMVAWNLRPTPPVPETIRFQIPPPGTSDAQMFTLSADGRSLAFVANTGGPNQLWVRAMDTLEARALPGTDGATYPFWSPDGASLGFFSQGKLKKIAIAGGPAQTLCDAADGRGGTWNRDGAIVFSPGAASPLLRVSAAGGVPAPATTLVEGDASAGHRFPVFLPDGVHFLYNAGSDKPDAPGLYVGSLDGSAAARLLPDGTNALYVAAAAPSGSGHLVFRREDTLMAQPFDPQALTLTGEMFPVAEQVPIGSGHAGFGAFSASETGTLVYRTGGPESNRELVWMDRTGKRLRVVTKPGAMLGAPAISPDQRTAAVRINAGSGSTSDIWLQDLERDVISRFTFGPGTKQNPIWSPDGSRVALSIQTLRTRTYDIYQKPANLSGQEELLLHAGPNGRPEDWSPDGKWIVYGQTNQTALTDLWLVPLEGDRKPIPYLQTRFDERAARFWPGPGAPRWMAYQSNESGQSQIHVQAIPASGGKYQVSTSGGTQPAWRRDGKELYYLSTDQKLMAVPITVGTSVTLGTPQPLFAADITGYTPSSDGQRFLMNVPVGGQAPAASPITVVLNWTAGLER